MRGRRAHDRGSAHVFTTAKLGAWSASLSIAHLPGQRTLRLVGVRDDETDEQPVLVVEDVAW
jgi:hypothetical protein